MNNADQTISRRDFVKAGAAVAAVGVTGRLFAQQAGSARTLNVGLIGCGGRGTGAAVNSLEASPHTRLIALADVFEDRLSTARQQLLDRSTEFGGRVDLDQSRCFIGFDAAERLIALPGVDVVLLATPPHFRPMHLASAVNAGKHVFMEKPVAVDPVGVRSVLNSAQIADDKRLSIVAGTQRRHENSYLETMKRIGDGAIGRIVSARCYWNQGGLWNVDRTPQMSDMEWQLRNWLYFTWLSGDHILEQHIHNIDVINWALNAHPVKASGMGGRQVRTDPAYGHVFDHFAVEYEYPGGIHVLSMCRQIDGCASRVEEVLVGTEGECITAPGKGIISGTHAWHFGGTNNNPYLQEHVDLIDSIEHERPINEARAVAESSLTAIMGRMSAYTGKTITWEQAMNSSLDLSPAKYEFGTLPVAEVAVPGRTPLI